MRFFFFGILSVVGAGFRLLACARALAVSFTTFALSRSSSFSALPAWPPCPPCSPSWGIARNGQTVDWVVPELLGLKPLQLGN